MAFIVPESADSTKIYGNVVADGSVVMAKCACVSCNSCTCACSCRESISNEDFWA